MKQIWFCEVCQQAGEVTTDDHIDVMSMIYVIEDAHHAKLNGCMNSVRTIRVLNDDFDTLPQWAQEAVIADREDTAGGEGDEQ